MQGRMAVVVLYGPSRGLCRRLTTVRLQPTSLRGGFSALMTPIRANIVGPFFSATRIRHSIAACHSAASCSALGSLVMRPVAQGDEFLALWQSDWLGKWAIPRHRFDRIVPV